MGVYECACWAGIDAAALGEEGAGCAGCALEFADVGGLIKVGNAARGALGRTSITDALDVISDKSIRPSTYTIRIRRHTLSIRHIQTPRARQTASTSSSRTRIALSGTRLTPLRRLISKRIHGANLATWNDSLNGYAPRSVRVVLLESIFAGCASCGGAIAALAPDLTGCAAPRGGEEETGLAC